MKLFRTLIMQNPINNVANSIFELASENESISD